MSASNGLKYENALVLGPMVRVSTFPMRLLCLKYGATLAYGPEIIDYKLINSKRKLGASTNTIEFVAKDKETRLIFKTFCSKKEPVVCQIGSCDAIKFLRSSAKVCKYVHGIDLNMGCPKPFSINKGIGASLLHPNKMHIVEDILKTWKRNKVSNYAPLSVKIRLLKSKKKTIALCRMIEKCDVDCIALHARYIEDRSDKVSARNGLVKDIVNVIKIPMIYNGDVFKYADIDRQRSATHCEGVMIGRGAIHNPSIFNSKGLVNINDVVSEYMDLCAMYKYPIHKCKFVMEKMILSQSCFKKKSSIFQEFHHALTYHECRDINSKLQSMTDVYQ
eukprot:73128_1